MQKKSLLALLLVASLLLSGCALITVDEDVDNARVIIDVNGETVTKQAFNNALDYQLYMNEQMNSYYSMFGMEAAYSTDRATVQSELVTSYINTLVSQQKSVALGFDQMTEEETAAIQETAETNYEDLLHQIADAYFPDEELEEDALHEKAEAYAKENGMATLEDYVKSAAEEKAVEKLRADAVKDVAVTEEDLSAALTERADSAKTSYETAPDQYGSAVNSGSAVYYAPAGYRMVKHVLVKFTEADTTAITAAQTALTQANTALTDATTAKTNAAEDADTEALQKAVDEAQAQVDEANAALDAAKTTAYANIQQKTDDIYAKATAEGADFDALVAEFNEDTGMPAAGYAIREGYAYFVAPFTTAAMALEKIGDVSQPVASDYGYHILQYSADVAEGTVALDTVREALEAELLTAKQNEAYAAALATWVSEATVKTYLDRLN